jgi:deazaflavin-dependent oxidoreductase (nitroreductase family)
MQNPDFAKALARAFKILNAYMVLLWRLGLGPWLSIAPRIGGRYVVITHTGRKTGKHRRNPVNYTIRDGDIYVAAGFGKTSDWYKNIVRNPHVEVWLPEGWWEAEAEEITDQEIRLPLIREVLVNSGFATFLGGINPYTITDERLAQATRTYPLLRLRRAAPCTGSGGPGDLAWVWPLATWILLPLALRRKKKRNAYENLRRN